MYKKLKTLCFVGLLFPVSECFSSDQEGDDSDDSLDSSLMVPVQPIPNRVIPGMPSLNVSTTTDDSTSDPVTNVTRVDVSSRFKHIEARRNDIQRRIAEQNARVAALRFRYKPAHYSKQDEKQVNDYYQELLEQNTYDLESLLLRERYDEYAFTLGTLKNQAETMVSYHNPPELKAALNELARLKEELRSFEKSVSHEKIFFESPRLNQSVAGQGATGGSPSEPSLPPRILSTARPSQTLPSVSPGLTTTQEALGATETILSEPSENGDQEGNLSENP